MTTRFDVRYRTRVNHTHANSIDQISPCQLLTVQWKPRRNFAPMSGNRKTQRKPESKNNTSRQIRLITSEAFQAQVDRSCKCYQLDRRKQEAFIHADAFETRLKY